MKILLVALIASEACPVFSLEMARGFRENGHEVYAVISRKAINYDQWIMELGTEHVRALDNDGAGIKKYTNVLKFMIRGKKALGDFCHQRFDTTIYTFYHRWNPLVKRYIRTGRSLLIIHDPVAHSGVGKLRAFSADRQYRSMDGAIVLTKAFIPIVSERFGYNENNIYYMPHFMMFHSGNGCQEICPMVPDFPVHFLFFGRIEHYKGVEVLIRAFLRLEKRYQDITLTIAGNGDFSPYEGLVSGNERIITDIRYIPDNDVDRFFTQPNTVLVLPYLDATQSGVLSIAFLHGNPVIASDTGGLKEQLDHGKIGLFAEPGNIEGLARRMEELLQNRKLMEEQSEKMAAFSEQLTSTYAVKQLCNQMKAEASNG